MPEWFQNLDEIRGYAKKHVGLYDGRNGRFTEDETYYWNEHTLDSLPKKAVEVRPPTVADLVDDYILAMTYKMPTFRHLAVSDHKHVQDGSERLTAFLNVLFERVEIQKLYIHMIWYMMVRGPVCIRTLHDPKAFTPLPDIGPKPPDYPASMAAEALEDYAAWVEQYNEQKMKRRRAEEKRIAEHQERLPIRIDLLDPQYVFPDIAEDPSFTFLRWERPASEIRSAWPHVTLPDVGPDQKVTWWEYWDTKRYAYWVESFRGSPARGGQVRNTLTQASWVSELKPHGYNFLPFVFDGPRTRPTEDLNKRYYSVITMIKSLAKQEAMFASQKATLIKNLAWAPVIAKSGRLRNIRLNLEPMEVTTILPEEELDFLVPKLPVGLIESAELDIGDKIQRRGVPNAALGRQATRSAAQQALIASHGRLSLQPAEQCVQRVLSRVGGNVLRLVERAIGEEVVVVGEYDGEDVLAKARPYDINGNYRVKVTLTTPFQEEKLGLLPLVAQLLALGLISKREASEMLEINRPQRQRLQLLVEKVIEHPAMEQALMMEAIEEYWPEMAPTVFQIMSGQQGTEQTTEETEFGGENQGLNVSTPGPAPGSGVRRQPPRVPRETPAGRQG